MDTPPNLREAVRLTVRQPNSCGICKWYQDKTCVRYDFSVNPRQVCDSFEVKSWDE